MIWNWSRSTLWPTSCNPAMLWPTNKAKSCTCQCRCLSFWTPGTKSALGQVTKSGWKRTGPSSRNRGFPTSGSTRPNSWTPRDCHSTRSGFKSWETKWPSPKKSTGLPLNLAGKGDVRICELVAPLQQPGWQALSGGHKVHPRLLHGSGNWPI